MWKYLLFSTCVVLIVIGTVRANITNGDFSQSFNVGWVASDGVVLFPFSPIESSPAAQFLESEYTSMTLQSLPFTLSEGWHDMSFDIYYISGGGGESDTFNATLYFDNGVEIPVMDTWTNSGQSGMEIGDIINKTFKVSDTEGDYTGYLKFTFTADLRNLLPEDDNDYRPPTIIFVDNVSVPDAITNVIPAPGALMLAGIGLGCFGVLRRRRAL